MKLFSRTLLGVIGAALLAVCLIKASSDDITFAPYLAFRSPARNTARKIMGLDAHTHIYGMDTFYGTLNATFVYERSFRPSDIASKLFGPALTSERTVLVQGTGLNFDNDPATPLVANRSATALDAGQLFLPTNFNGGFKITPRVQNFLVDFQVYLAFDEWVKGLYLRLYGPVVHTKYDLNAENLTPTTSGAAVGYAAGRFATTPVLTNQLFSNPLDFFAGNSLPAAITDITVQPLQNAKIKPDSDKETSFGELRAEFGYDFLLQEDYHLGVNIQAAFPTGHRPEGTFLFEAETSNGKSFELGGGITGLYTLWRSEDGDHHLDFIVEADITHMFRAKQTRTFDLVGKPLSRYMLAEKMGAISPEDSLVTGTADGDMPNPAVQFQSEYAPVANFSTREVKVSAGAQIDAVAMLAYVCRGWEWDLGYNFWYRSKEKISLRSEQPAFPTNVWALKGDAIVFGATDVDDFANTAVALSATESGATIFQGGNFTADRPATDPEQFNRGIDSPAQAFGFVNEGDETVALHFSTNDDVLNTSSKPILITEADLALDAARTKGLSHKIFGYIGYSWINREDWIPYIGLAFEAEFGTHHSTDSTPTTVTSGSNDNDGARASLSKWAVDLRIGISFD